MLTWTLTQTLVVIGYMGFSSVASATDLLIEPYLGYHSAKFTETGVTPNATGLTYGARLGGDYMNFQFGLDYMSGGWSDDQSPQDNITPNNLGVFFGFKFPAMLRVYGTYFFNEQYKFKNSSASHTYDGTEFKFGLGLTSLPVININFEYGMGTLTTDNGNTMNHNITLSYFGLVISAPLEF